MVDFDPDFPKADPVSRGCGDREPGGVYVESGLSSRGRPLEEFLVDPPLPVPAGLDLVNKPQIWQRMLPSGEPALDVDELPIFDLLIWVGAEFYPYCVDYLEEVRRYGASRRLNPNIDLSLLSKSSRMILAHPLVINTAWQHQCPPESCLKEVPGHDASIIMSDHEGVDAKEGRKREMIAGSLQQDTDNNTKSLLPPVLPNAPKTGPCLFKLWELIPVEAAQTVIEVVESEAGNRHAGAAALPLCLRQIGSTVYQFHPTGESADGLVPGVFAVLPITGFALIRFQDGSVCPAAQKKTHKNILMHPLFVEGEMDCLPADPVSRRQASALREAIAPYLCLDELRRLATSGENILAALKSIEEIPEEVQALISLLQVLLAPRKDERITQAADLAALLMLEMGGLDHEEFWVACLDTKNHVQRLHCLYKGSLNSSVVRVCELFRLPLQLNSAAIIVAHNHPSSSCQASPEDIEVTKLLIKAGQLLEIEMLDHLIIGQGSWMSMRQQGLGW